MNQQITQLLDSQGINYREHADELITHCIFNDCDADSHGSEAHLYINRLTGQYMCHKCGEKGGIHALKQKLGVPSVAVSSKRSTKVSDLNKQAEQMHVNLPVNIRDWLITERLLLPEDIDDHLLGYGEFYGKKWVTIPITDAAGQVLFYKLRQDPFTTTSGAKYMSSGGEATIFNSAVLADKPDNLVICEGEFDTLVLKSKGISAISSTAGANTFKDEWIPQLAFARHIYIVFDNDDAGGKGALSLIDKLSIALPHISIMRIKIPEILGDKADVTDYFRQPGATLYEFFDAFASHAAGPKPIDTSTYQEMSTARLSAILDHTIKHDNENKLIAFLCMLSAYTDDSQLNCSFNAPSSTGKSYIPLELAYFFPAVDVKEYGGASPTAFYHDEGTYDKERNCHVVNLERKILVFLEQPNPKLQENLRPVLSHDRKEISYKITDKNQKGSNRAKHIIIRGFAATIFCSAAMRLDEQEATRAILLSPETSVEKVSEGIHLAAIKASDKAAYRAALAANPDRRELIDRVLAIKQAHVTDIIVPNIAAIEQRFKSNLRSIRPRNQRDIAHLLAIIKSITLLNVWLRYDENGDVVSSETDVDEGFAIWEKLNVSQELNLPPYVFDFYNKFVVPLYIDKNADRAAGFIEMIGQLGVSRKELNERYFSVEKHVLNADMLNRQILPMLEAAGVIRQEKDPDDKRSKIIFPLILPTPNNTEKHGGATVSGDGI